VHPSHDLVIRDLRLFALVALIAYLGPFGLANAADAPPSGAPRRIGVLFGGLSPNSNEAQQFRKGLRDAGYSEGRDVVIEWRTAGGDVSRTPELAADLVQSKVEVIVATGTVATQAAKRATSTIPIVMTVVADPVGSGLVTSLAHPGGNVTGFSSMLAELSAKRLQLLKQAVPGVARVAVLWNPDTPWHARAVESLKAARPSLSIELNFVSARSPEGFASAFSAITRSHGQALCVLDDALFLVNRATLVKLASKARLPVIYGANFGGLFRQSAGYVDKILKGAKPGDLPIEQPTKFELVINLKTAKALGITIPESILLRADEVIR